jgi:hypothetical protein
MVKKRKTTTTTARRNHMCIKKNRMKKKTERFYGGYGSIVVRTDRLHRSDRVNVFCSASAVVYG